MDSATAHNHTANGLPKLRHEPSSLVSDGTIEIKTDSSSSKRKLDNVTNDESEHQDKRRKGTAPIKEEYLLHHEHVESKQEKADDDAAEAFHHQDRSGSNNSKGQRKKQKGQNKDRRLKAASDEVGLCSTRNHASEFSPRECPYGDKCKFEHDLRRYLKESKKDDLTTFDGVCPVWAERGACRMGWACRFAKSHSKEIEHPDGRKELVLVEDSEKLSRFQEYAHSENAEIAVVNNIDTKDKQSLTRKKFPTPKSDKYIPYLEVNQQNPGDQGRRKPQHALNGRANSSSPEPDESEKADNRSNYVEAPLLPSEKRRLYFGPDTPTLAPLTTQGNLPFRRLCTTLGATFTYSEMAMSLPLLSGQKSEWALLKAHESEIHPPTFISNEKISSLPPRRNIVYDYGYTASSDVRFGAQISANKPWLAIKTTEVLSTLLPQGLRVIDMNCGCPIDLVYKEGAGSALMDSPSKLDKMLRGMNSVSGAIPVSCKIRMGTKTGQPTAQKLVERLVLGAYREYGSPRDTPCGVAAITLHGRSRQQRYTREADWDYISETAALISDLNARVDAEADTIREADPRDQANGHSSRQSSKHNPVFFLGNGDCFSHVDYYNHLEQAGVDSVMLGRGALIKPWIFEEIALNQYLDKSSSQRLSYIETFVKNGLAAWGTDTHGISTTRRFLLEYLSFAHRYVPIGLLEYLPPRINDRPPRYAGRDELETLLASDSYKDWIKISEIFLGTVKDAEGLKGGDSEYGWVPKHKSNAWDGEAQG
ncbi:tRNA-dihydrouridine synthase 3 [Neophaeococcomyces mojaviensis]|uniref:tRNA-dihydrouridine synthase 3 n=1 Tax=Neophaeococcomyces mojaviensis TaxID=3383035 RepID=A0ACC3AJX9_9EURO|nr:tRNA-dihydrouridine synthase 3 [Knufia sp. JES_112]